MDLLAKSSGQSPEDFTQTLLDNADRALSYWRDLYGNLLAAHDGGRDLGYAETFQPKADNVTKY